MKNNKIFREYLSVFIFVLLVPTIITIGYIAGYKGMKQNVEMKAEEKESMRDIAESGENDDFIFINQAVTLRNQLQADLTKNDGFLNIAVIIFDFQSPNTINSHSTIYAKPNKQDLQNILFGTEKSQLAGFMYDNSYGKVKIRGNVFELSSPIPHTDTERDKDGKCPEISWVDDAMKIAREENIPLEDYDRYVFIYFRPYNCTITKDLGIMAASGEFNGKRILAPYNLAIAAFGDYVTDIAHELGHNFGLMHATSEDVKDTIIYDVEYRLFVREYLAMENEYGDRSDVMGSGTGHYLGAFKEFLGWIEPSEILEVSSCDNCQLTIAAIETKKNRFKLIKILPKNATYLPYYVELRNKKLHIYKFNPKRIETTAIYSYGLPRLMTTQQVHRDFDVKEGFKDKNNNIEIKYDKYVDKGNEDDSFASVIINIP